MVSPHRNPKDLVRMIRDKNQDMGDSPECQGECRSPPPEDQPQVVLLRSRIEEQSQLIQILKQRSDQTHLRCQALLKINEELGGQVSGGQKELDSERSKASLLEKRFNEMASNYQGIVVFKDDYKRHNVQLLEENKLLRTENEALLFPQVQEKEILICQLQQELHLQEEKHKATGDDLREKEAGWKSELLKQKSIQHTQEAALLERLNESQNSLKAAQDTCTDLKHQLQQAADGNVFRETEMKQMITTLSAEKDNFLNLSMERGKVIQEKQEKILQLEIKLEEVEKVRARAENRFKQQAEAVNLNVKVRSLQVALDEALKKNEQASEDLAAYKEHSSYLLAREKELNAKLCSTFSQTMTLTPTTE